MLFSQNTNTTCLRDELYAMGKLKEGVPREPCEDDLMFSTRVESISSIKFFNHLQLGDVVFHSQAYTGITIGNHHTDDFYGCQRCWPVELSLLKCQKVRNILPTQYHATLGFPVNHIIPISKPKQAIYCIVCLRLIVDVCIQLYKYIFFAT